VVEPDKRERGKAQYKCPDDTARKSVNMGLKAIITAAKRLNGPVGYEEFVERLIRIRLCTSGCSR
jgi:hypothetical protein